MSVITYFYTAIIALSGYLMRLDEASILNFVFFLATLTTLSHYARGFFYAVAQRTILSSVRIHDEDLLYGYLVRWITETQMQGHQVCVEATVPHSMSWQDEQLAADQTNHDPNAEIEDQALYRALVARRPIRFLPYAGYRVLRYKRHFIVLHHAEWKEMQGGNSPRPRFYVKLECLGRSPHIIKELLHEAQFYYHAKAAASTTVYRAHFGTSHERAQWAEVISRQSRAINSVILEKRKKEALLADISEYLHPKTRKWYLEHGIPYRRGYLFSGPPGTGKTSLTSALAGAFGLDIYNLSLLEPSSSEDKLSSLFSALPSRCILLLEDIDAAGLNRKSEAVERNDIHRSNISLSGLLNAIDGVTSPEGRILIMTTNHREALDGALIRPGRVDMHVAFSLPTSVEIEELFLGIYQHSVTAGDDPTVGAKLIDGRNAEKLSKSSLDNLARDFASVMPEGRFSLATVQGYLLRHKSNPAEAIAGVQEWIQESSE